MQIFNTALLIVILALAPVTLQSQLSVVNGWTQFSASTDTRLIYVSSVSGNDATARSYFPSAVEIGNDPFKPTGAIMAYQTLAAARAQLRNGYPDWILFKNGETWTNQRFGVTTLYGRNHNEPMLIGSYGASAQRPTILTGNQGFIDLTGSSSSYLAVVGIQCEPHTRAGNDEPIGIRIISAPFTYVIIEDCYVSKYFQNLAIHDPTFPNYPTRSRLIMRRNILADAYVTSSSHANCMFIDNVDTVVFHENLLDHNGWSSTISGATPTGFRHNSYFQVNCRHLSFSENIIARAAATGGGHRCGGSIIDNLYIANPKNIQFGTHESTLNWPTEFVTGEVAYNVVLDARMESFEQGTGIQIQRVKNATIHHNIIAHFTPNSQYNNGLFCNETENINVYNNVIYKWGNNTSSGPAYSNGLAVGSSLLGINTISNNDIQMKNSKGYCVSKYGTFGNVSFSGNRYFNSNSATNWFEPGGTIDGWKTQSGETNAVNMNVGYSNPEKSISTYLASIGESGGIPEFLQLRRQNSKSNWQSKYTAHVVNEYIRAGFDFCTTPAAADSITGVQSVCKGQNSVFYSIPPISNALSYSWTLPTGASGTSTTNSILVNFGSTAQSGSITVKGVNTCGDGALKSLPITVNARPDSAASITGSTIVCKGQNGVPYSIPIISNAVSYRWTLPSGVTGNSTSNTILVHFDTSAQSGKISVKGVNVCGDGDSSSIQVIVQSIPKLLGGITGPTTICKGQKSVTYTIPAHSDVDTYRWTIPTGATGTSTTNSITLNFGNTAQSGTITVQGVNSCGTGEGIFLPISVTSLPDTARNIIGMSEVCQGQNSLTYSVTAIANANTYIWTLPTGVVGSSTSDTIVVNFGSDAQSGNVSVQGRNTCGDGEIAIFPVIVHKKPVTPTISRSNTILRSNATIGNQWYNQAGMITGATSQDYTVTSDGDYYVVVQQSNCSSDPSNTIRVVVSGVEEIETKTPMKITPNPANHTIAVSSEFIMKELSIFTSTGELLRSYTIDTSFIEIDSKDLPNGTYILRQTQKNGVETSLKIIIAR